MNLHNPERAWTRAPPAESARALVEARLGPVDTQVETLAGGLASLCFGIGDRVLRIARDASTLDLEEACLGMGWGFFRSPSVMGRGDDWLLLERVPHTSLCTEDGAAVGSALAEIHALEFNTCGWLDGALRLRDSLPDFPNALLEHAASLGLEPGLTARVHGHLRRFTRDDLGPARLLHGDFKVSNVHGCGNTVLVLDWEHAYAGPALMDVGQLMRWDAPQAFVAAFERSYRAHGGELPDGWLERARALDVINLAALLARSAAGTQRKSDLGQQLDARLA